MGAQNLSARDQAVPLPVSLHLPVCKTRPVTAGFLLGGAGGHSDERSGLKAFLTRVLGTLEESGIKGDLMLSGWAPRCWSRASWWEATHFISRGRAWRGDASGRLG